MNTRLSTEKNNYATINIALLLCAFTSVSFFWGQSGIIKYLLKYIPLLLSLYLLLLHLLKNKGYFSITIPDILFGLCFIYLFFRMSPDTISGFGLSAIFGYCLCLLYFGKTDFNAYRIPLILICIVCIFYTITIPLEVVFPDQISNFASLYSSCTVNAVHLGSAYVSGICGSAAYAAGYAAYSLAILLICHNLGYKIKYYPVLIVLLFVALIMTGKRGHFVFFLFSMTVINICLENRDINIEAIFKHTMYLLVILMIFCIGAVFFPKVGVFERFLASIETVQQGGDITSDRWHLYEGAVMQFRDAPIFGIGWQKYVGLIYYNGRPIEVDTHNTYLQLLCETGLVGFSLYVMSIFCIYIKTMRRLRDYIRLSDDKWAKLCLSFSLFIQTFINLYGFTSSSLYDPGGMIIYFFACVVAESDLPKGGCLLENQNTDISLR